MSKTSGLPPVLRRWTGRGLRAIRQVFRRRRARERAAGDASEAPAEAAVGHGRRWLDQLIVVGHAGLVGVLVVGFTLLSEAASDGFAALRGGSALGPWLMLLWTPALTVALLWWTRRFARGAGGSGIPQVLKALDDTLEPGRQSALVSLRLSLHKIVLVSGGMLAGLSIGREGPTVQVGAGVMASARRWLSRRSRIDAHDLMVAGAAAGIAAAFNTPLGGIVFALEQLSRRRQVSHSTLVIGSIVLAGMVSIAVFGNVTYFGRLRVQELTWDLLGPGLLVAVAAGLLGAAFSRLMVAASGLLPGPLGRWRASAPLRFAATCALLVAVLGLLSNGATAGAGYLPTREMLEGREQLPVIFTAMKFGATLLSAWTGVPAGTFAPSLTIGAGIGRDVALLTGLPPEAAIPLIALGMVGFLAASTQGPITAFIIVMEMVSGHSMVLSLMACALLANGIAGLLSRPMYQELADALGPPRGDRTAGRETV